MAEVIVKQQGCIANRIAYPRAVDAFHQALQMLSERSPSPAGPGFSLDLAGGSVTVPVRTGITVQRTERRTWIVASIDDEHHEISAVECATRHAAHGTHAGGRAGPRSVCWPHGSRNRSSPPGAPGQAGRRHRAGPGLAPGVGRSWRRRERRGGCCGHSWGALMQSRNKRAPTVSERRHIERVARLPCSLCDRPGPSEVHEISQGQWYTSIALCADCHRGSLLGLHGQRRAWIVRKATELDALGVTVRRLMAEMEQRTAGRNLTT